MREAGKGQNGGHKSDQLTYSMYTKSIQILKNLLGTFFCKLFIGFVCINKAHSAFCVVVRKENFIKARISLIVVEKFNKLSHS